MTDLPVRPDDSPVLFDIGSAATALPETGRREPARATMAAVGEIAEPAPLDPGRAKAAPSEKPAEPRRQRLTAGLAGSLAVHLSPLLLLLHFSGAPPEIAPPIPVQLAFEPPPAPPIPPAPKKTPRPGRLASEDMGETAAKLDRSAATAEPAADRPDETVVAAALPPPKPIPPPKLVSALPNPAPPAEPAALPEEPRANSLAAPPVKQAVAARLPANPRSARHAQVLGPAATRDEYLNYCMLLIRRHFGLLSPSFLAGRRGATVLRIEVLGDGTITQIAVAQRSPYPDIDARIEEAVAAVRRFPPVPQWFQGASLGLSVHVAYPEGL